MVRLRIASLLLACCFPVMPAFAEDTAARAIPGGPAPALVVSKWLKGEPIERFEPGRVYVVDLWATWCKPCLTTMPLLGRIEKRYGNDATFIAMNVWEMNPKGVPRYIASHSDSMPSTVAADSLPPGKEANEGLVAVAYLGTSEHVAIPTTFVIDREGRIAWIGQPLDLEGPLSRVIAGTWDLKPFAEKYAEEQRIELRYRDLLRPVEQAVTAGEWEKAYEASEVVAAVDSSFAERVAGQGFGLIAMSILRLESAAPADMMIALKAAERSIALQKDPGWITFQMAAQAARAAGDLDRARTHLKAAIDRADGEDLTKLQAELELLNGGK